MVIIISLIVVFFPCFYFMLLSVLIYLQCKKSKNIKEKKKTMTTTIPRIILTECTYWTSGIFNLNVYWLFVHIHILFRLFSFFALDTLHNCSEKIFHPSTLVHSVHAVGTLRQSNRSHLKYTPEFNKNIFMYVKREKKKKKKKHIGNYSCYKSEQYFNITIRSNSRVSKWSILN